MAIALPTYSVRVVVILGLLVLVWHNLYNSDTVARKYLFLSNKVSDSTFATPNNDDRNLGLSPGTDRSSGNAPDPAADIKPGHGTTKKTEPMSLPVPQSSDVKLPPGVRKIMLLIFYGRRGTISILDCYLKRNLVKNGGLIDGVIFLVRTNHGADLEALEKLLAREPAYQRRDVKIEDGYPAAYDLVEDDILYIKMDDDIVFIEDSAIPSVVHTKLTRPDLYAVIANVVNQPLMSWLHWNLGVVKPYLPELNVTYPDPKPGQPFDWRVSNLPEWEGPSGFVADDWEPPGKHRWLPVKDKLDHVLDNTSIISTTYDPSGPGWFRWQVGAQQHYSLLEHIEKNELWRYRFHTWDFQYARMGIQFIAIMGSDINRGKPIDRDDEWHFANTVPKALGRHVVADGRGIVVHYSFGAQYEGMKHTDILDRYRAYARENICTEPMVWSPEEENM